MIDDDKDEIDMLDDRQTFKMINKLEVLEQLEALKKALQNKGLTKKEIKNLVRTQYNAIKNFYN
jgi:hypothetical protein